MSLVAWIVVGLVAGWIAGKVTHRGDQGCITKIVVGVIGALIGGALANAAGLGEIEDFSIRTILIAAVGATLFLLVLDAITGRRA